MKIRHRDCHGSGAYRASRGSKLHRGLDVCCEQGSRIFAFSGGKVTKIGFPYLQGADPCEKYQAKKALRYVQVTDAYGVDVRYFYVNPAIPIGAVVHKGTLLGVAQGLAHIYPGITEHYHFEALMLVDGRKVFMDPEQYLRAIGAWQ